MSELTFPVEPNATTTLGARQERDASLVRGPGEGAGADASPAPSQTLGRVGHTDHDPELIKRCMAITIWHDRDRGRELCPVSKDGRGRPINWRRWFWERYGDALEMYLEREGLL